MLLCDASQGRKLSNTGVSQNDIDSSLCLDGLVETIKVGQFGNISLNAGNIAADCLHCLIEFLLTTARDEDVSTFCEISFNVDIKNQSVRYECTTPCILASVPHPHQHAAERPVLDQVANRVRRVGERKHFGDGWPDRTFGQIADECLLRCGQRLRREGPKSEATYLCCLPDDIGEVHPPL